MAGKTQAHTDSVLNLLRGSGISAITPYVGLFSTAPANDASAGTELSGSGYARQSITFGAPATDTGNVRKIANTNTITFGPASADWSAAVAFGVFDASSGGNLIYWDSLTASRTILNGDSGQFAAGALVVNED
jgi:hypothetical protein